MPDETESTSKPKRKFPFAILLVLLALVLGIGGTVLTARQKPEFLGLAKGSAQVQAEVDTLVEEVRKLIELPTDEKPTVATITDVEKLKEQSFFKNAKNGDKVLVYTGARKAILYRPDEKRLIEVGAVNINRATTDPSATLEPGATPQAVATQAPAPVATQVAQPTAQPQQ